MVSVHPQYIVDEHQERKAVLLPFAEWQRIVENLEPKEYELGFERSVEYL